MRAGPLSNDRVIDILNDYFVPVFVSNEDYEGSGPASKEEREQRHRIWREAGEAGLSSGTVHAYVLAEDGRVIDSLHVAEAAKVERTLEMLERAVARLQPKRAPRSPESGAPRFRPQAAEGEIVLHLVARYLKKTDTGLETLLGEAGLGSTRNASWQAYPAENWIVLNAEEAARLLAGASLRPGESWTPAPPSLAGLLVHFYPSTECNDPKRNRIEEQVLEATVLSAANGRVRCRLEGRLRMKHNFYPGREDGRIVAADLLGYLDFEAASRKLLALRLITSKADYAGWPFGVALRSIEDGSRPR